MWGKILATIWVVALTLGIAFSFAGEINQEPKIVKCYDKFQNEIIGLECLNEGIQVPLIGIILFSLALVISIVIPVIVIWRD